MLRRDRIRAPFFVATLGLASTTVGCGGGLAERPSLAGATIDEVSYPAVRRAYLTLDPTDPDRHELEERLFAYLAPRAEAVVRAGDYEAVVAMLAELTALLTPADFASTDPLPTTLEPLARFVIEHGARRGDEARVLAGWRILRQLAGADQAATEAAYEEVARWGHDARRLDASDISSLVRAGSGLTEVWEEHARLSPAPDVLERLAGIFVTLRNIVRGSAEADAFRPPTSLDDMEALGYVAAIVDQAPIEAAAVFLRQGDLPRALESLEDTDRLSTLGEGLRSLVRDAQSEDRGGARALYEMATRFSDGRSDVTVALCRLGERRFPIDPRFPLCLARVAITRSEISDAGAYYRDAIALAPTTRELYDEALRDLSDALGEQRGITGAGESRTTCRATTDIITERELRFGAEGAPLDRAMVEHLCGRAELAAGEVERAREHLRASLTLGRRGDVLQDLGTLELRVGHYGEARASLREVLAGIDETDALGRAHVLTLIGDSHRFEGDAALAGQSYRAALELVGGESAAELVVRGTIASRLGVRDDAVAAFRSAIQQGVDPGVATEVLMALAVWSPDGDVALETLARARVSSRLASRARVELALLAGLATARAGGTIDPSVFSLLEREAGRGGFPSRLAAHVAGTIDASELAASAESRRERCEAAFYEAVRLLTARGADAASGADVRARLRAALETGMVELDEYRMAQELLALLPHPSVEPTAGPPTASR